MLREVRAIALLSVFATLIPGCAINAVRSKAEQRHYRFTWLETVSRATLWGDSLFTELRVKRYPGYESEVVVLRVPLGESQWGYSPNSPWNLYQDEQTIQHVPSEFLESPQNLPENGEMIPITRVQLDTLGALTDASADLGPGIHVLEVSFHWSEYDKNSYREIYEKNPLPSNPVLVILRTEEAQCGPEPIVVGDFPEGYSKHKGWLALMPIAVPADIVTFPLQLLAALIMGGC